MNFIKKTIILTTLPVIFFVLKSQSQLQISGYEVGINAGTLVYQGDLSRSFIGNYKILKPAVGVNVSKNLDSYFALRLQLIMGKLKDDESMYASPEFKRFRNYSFSTPITELSASVVFDLFGDKTGRRLSPYIFAGAGLTHVNIKRDWSRVNRTVYGEKSEVQLGLAIDSVKKMPKLIPILPVGVGLNYALNDQFSLRAEATYRLTATDYLDGFKYAANSKRRDSYYGVSIGVSYRFGGYKCPPIKR
jgi:opacity protein-like surface antigen